MPILNENEDKRIKEIDRSNWEIVDYNKEELFNLQEIQETYKKLRKFFQGKTISLNKQNKKYLKRIEINNLLMTILHITEGIHAGINSSKENIPSEMKKFKYIFGSFFCKLGIPISTDEDLDRYLNLFRNSIAHHSGYSIDLSEDSYRITFDKKEKISEENSDKKPEKNIKFTLSEETLSELAGLLLGIFKDKPEIQKHFSRGLRFNNLIEKILANEDISQEHIRIEDIDLSHTFYISSLFEMVKYMKKSITKAFESSIKSKENIEQMLGGLNFSDDEKNFININDILHYNETIKYIILFYYNAYPKDVIEIFEGITFKNKSIKQLLDEYNIKITEKQEEKTDFEKLIEISDNHSEFQNLKEKLVNAFLEKLPPINTLYFYDNSIEIMPSIELLLDGFKNNSNADDEIIYWSSQEGELRIYTFMDKIRNAVMHNKTDIQYVRNKDGEIEPRYSFQDNYDGTSDFIATHISSLQLQEVIFKSAKILQEINVIINSQNENTFNPKNPQETDDREI